VPAFDVNPACQCDFGLGLYCHRAGCCARRRRWCCVSRGGQNDRLAVDQIAGPDRERFPAAVPVLEFDSAVLDTDHRTDEPGLGVLDDHAEFHRLLG
jgi:hypothetical protein